MQLRKISDDLLIGLYREGNQDAIDMLFERYKTFIYGIINDVFCNFGYYVDYEDMFQESMVVFLDCLRKYDVDNGCFYFFVRTSIERRLINKIKRIKKNMVVKSLDVECFDDGNEKIIDYVAEEDKNSVLEDLFIEKLDGINKDIAVLKIKGFSYEDIADVLQINKQFIYRRMVKIKKVLKDIIKN